MSSRSIAVIGLGAFGSAIASHVSRYGDHVLGLDLSESCVARLADDLSRAVVADARELRALEEAGLGSYDVAVVCIAKDIEANLLAVMNARDVGVKEVWAKASSSTHARILRQVGVERVIMPEETMGEVTAQALHNPLMKGSVRLTERFHLAHITAPKRVCGKPLSLCKLTENEELRCLGLLRDGVVILAHDELEIQEGDEVLLAGTRSAMRTFADQ